MTRTRLFPLVFVLFTMTGFAQNGIITDDVGPGRPVDGTPAINQYINCTSLALNGADGLYVSSSFQNRIYWVKADGNLTALAGTGSAGFSGDGGPAAAARLNGPSGLAVDAAGNLYVADTRNHRIRKITPKGMIMTVAGDGTAGSGGDGGLAISAQLNYPVAIAVDGAGTLYIGDQSDRVRKVTAAGVIGTVAGTGVAGYSGDG